MLLFGLGNFGDLSISMFPASSMGAAPWDSVYRDGTSCFLVRSKATSVPAIIALTSCGLGICLLIVYSVYVFFLKTSTVTDVNADSDGTGYL